MLYTWQALRDLVPFAQFKKRENHPYKSATFREVAEPTLLKEHSSMGVFHIF